MKDKKEISIVTRPIVCHSNNAKKYCTAVAASVDSARDIVHTHNPLRAYVPPEPFSSCATPSQGLLSLALARKDQLVAATARTSCSWSISEPRSPMPLTAAADASRKRERERDAVAQRCIGHPTDGACEHRQCTDCSLAPQ